MTDRKLLVIGLDGFEISYVDQLMDAGELPALAALRDRSRRFLLDHGPSVRTGLAWEHFASGLTPEHAHRTSMVEFVGTEYNARQRGARFTPFFSVLDERAVIFDSPYTDIARSPGVRGIVSWGAHDPGVVPTSNPSELRHEIEARFGPYPSDEWTYKRPWSSARDTAATGEGLARGIDTRREVATWLLTERMPDWDLAVVVAGEGHSAAEAFWHGVDPDHPLHAIPSATVAAASLLEVYRAGDRLVAELVEATDPSAVVVFSMGGMGTNNADTPSMVLLPEFVYRWATGNTLLTMPDEWTADPSQMPIVPEGEDPLETISQYYATIPRTFTSRVKRKLRSLLKPAPSHDATGLDHSLDWQPTTKYRPHWARMRAFALPAFYDGRIRVNLQGREPAGIVELADYERTLDELEAALLECRDARTGEPVVDHCERATAPFSLDASEADLTVVWSAPANSFVHPTLGLVGPAPFFRTGGHTGPHGFAFISGDGIEAGDGGIRSAFDVAPTIADMLEFTPEPAIDGTSLLGSARV